MPMSRPTVALLRHQLFLPSEVFITEQARSLRRFRPLLLGRTVAGVPGQEVEYRTCSDAGRLDLARYVAFRDPAVFESVVKEDRPVLLHAHFGVEGVYGMRIAQRLRIPLVTTFHGFDATLKRSQLFSSRKASWMVYALHRAQLARHGALFICVSRFIHERILDLGFPSDRAQVHYIGVDTSSFQENAEDPARPILLHIARLVEKKGTRYLLQAFARIARRHPSAQLVVIGDGPLRVSLQALAAEYGIDGRVLWKGAQPHTEVKRWLNKASVFCLPSCTAESGDAEGLPMVLLEAAASGVPVVGTRHAGIPEAVIDGDTGFLVAERDVNGLADALDTLLSSFESRRRIGLRAKELVARNFDVHRQTSKLEDMYASLLQS